MFAKSAGIIIIVLVVVSCIGFCLASCPAVTTSQVEWAQYTGRWYEIATSDVPRATFERGCTCVTADYASKDDGHISVSNSCVQQSTRERKTTVGDAKIYGQGHLGVSFSSFMPRANYKIVDYLEGDYAVVWSCQSILGLRFSESMWVLSRYPRMNADKYNFLLRRARQLTGFDTTTMVPTIHDACFETS